MRNMRIPLRCQRYPGGFARNGAVLLGRNPFNDSLWPAYGVKLAWEDTYAQISRTPGGFDGPETGPFDGSHLRVAPRNSGITRLLIRNSPITVCASRGNRR